VQIESAAAKRSETVNCVPARGIGMNHTRNGIPAGRLPDVAWQKSRRSNPSGNCVELAPLPDGAGIAVRNSRDPNGPALIYTVDEIAAFINGARDGDFDNLIA
jgi:hypothetical protein